MRYLSLFSGIEAATQAWHPLGWKCVGVSEIEPFPCAVLAHHYPSVPNLGDVTKITEDDIKALGHIDIVVFGSPCQDLSIAGLRKGFICESTDTLTRSGLFFVAMRIVAWARKHCGCRFALWENVPGAFSSSKGRDFAVVVEHMAGLEDLPVPPKGWGTEGVAAGSEGLVEWAVLDAQWFGVAQRRRRVFALADFGNWANRQPILLEPESLRGDSAPSREAGKEVAGTISTSISSGSDPDTMSTLCATDAAKWGSNQWVKEGKAVIAFPEFLSGTQCASAEELCPSLGAANTTAVAYGIPGNWIGRAPENGGNAVEPMHDVSPCQTKTDRHGVATAMAVRRLSPVECERLQGFQDGYTDIMPKGKPTPDGPRYKALGNSMAVPVMHWIGKQIQEATK